MSLDISSMGNRELCGYFSGLSNGKQQLRPVDILKALVYAAAEAGAKEIIELIFSLSAAIIVFEAYKSDLPLPEDVAGDNGHYEVAEYLRSITKRYINFVDTKLAYMLTGKMKNRGKGQT